MTRAGSIINFSNRSITGFLISVHFIFLHHDCYTALLESMGSLRIRGKSIRNR